MVKHDAGRTQTANRNRTGRGGSSHALDYGFASDEHAILPGQNAPADAGDGIGAAVRQHRGCGEARDKAVKTRYN